MRMYAQMCYAFGTWDRLCVAEIRGAAFACDYAPQSSKIGRAVHTAFRFSAGPHGDIRYL